MREKLLKMQSYLEQPCPDDEEKIIQRMNYLQVLIAQSGQLMADAKFMRDAEIQKAIMSVMGDPTFVGSSATMIKEYVNSCAKEFNYLVNFSDRINSSATKQLQATISVLSYRKEQMKI
jgi:hypothetical protein